MSNQDLIADLDQYPDFSSLSTSSVYRESRARVADLLDIPVRYAISGVRPRLTSFIRVVAWNIQRGSRLSEIARVLNEHPVLRLADLLLLNELDNGMARSGNLDVTGELARAISANAVFGAEYLEFTRGVGPELEIKTQNEEALHGNAVLARYPLSATRVVRLPRCEDNFSSEEKRLGGRIGLIVDLETPWGRLRAVTSHLDVTNTPACRARQMKALLNAADSGLESGRPILFGGDLNTHTFARGNRFRSAKNIVRLLFSNPDGLASRLLDPERREPAIGLLRRHGYELDDLNDRSPTIRERVTGLNDSSWLPDPLRRFIVNRFGPDGLWLSFRLDWLAGRGVIPLGANELVDETTGERSIEPRTIQDLGMSSPISDHDPIVADVRIPGDGSQS